MTESTTLNDLGSNAGLEPGANMCNCLTWCRVPTDKYPMSNHHPNCEDYVAEEFARVEHDGTACVVELHEAFDLMGEGDQYTITSVWLTRDQFERLPEFAGF